MLLSEALGNLMNAGRKRFGIADKLSVKDLTQVLINPHNSNVLFFNNVNDIIANSNNDGVNPVRKDDYATINVFNTSHTDSNDYFYIPRIYFNAGISPADGFQLLLLMRKSSNSGDPIKLRVGPYENLVYVTVDSNDWKFYTFPLKTSTSKYISIYFDTNNTGPVIDIKAIGLVNPVGGGS
ncbi:hypothetical protein [Limosilactobacillus vaginalis]|uniref:hypothetical protein n=1 Tax=Limosilactobacillus vaginalis TaxID=1633 RepID=UPI001F095D72|nr:hypothetical protein [Limosilactobacillus vaginalis]